MRYSHGIVVVLAMALSPTVAEGQVYRCKGPSGTVYSQQPCSADAAPVAVRGTRAATPVEGGGDARDAIARSTAMSDAGIRERSCLSAASDRIYGPSNDRVADYQRQISGLNSQLSRTNNNLAGATAASGIREQIAGLNQAIATERVSADSQMGSARAQCAADRREAEQAVSGR